MSLEADLLLDLRIPERHIRYDDRDTLLYALSLGAGLGDDLSLIQETGQRVIPSFGQNLAFDDTWLETAGIDLADVVHAGLDLAFRAPFAPAGEAKARAKVIGLTDKGPGKAGLVHHETTIYQSGAPIFTSTSSMFVRGGGGFGGSRGTEPPRPSTPEDGPIKRVTVPTRPDQALLFRLLGDRNPLHCLPDVAREAGFERPILHGACTFGIACLTVLQEFCAGRPERMEGFAARFSGPVYPGEPLEFVFWHLPNGVAFTATAADRGTPVLADGRAKLKKTS